MIRSVVIGVAVVAWLGTVLGGTVILWHYKMTPGEAGEAPPVFPAGAAISLHPERPTLVMFAHPHCPCTRASVAELHSLMTRAQGKVDAVVLFGRPDGTGDDWEGTDLHQAAARIPGVRVVGDPGGVESQRFGALTSGLVHLYAPDGRQLFAGGITSSRGHEGDSIGKQRLLSLIRTGEADSRVATVYGCGLRTPNEEE